MKTAIVLGRGVEGCGVTQCAIQMQNVTGADIYATSDKKWPRAKGIEFPHTYFSAEADWPRVSKQLNEYDLVVFYSVPSKTHPEGCQSGFLNLVRDVDTRKVLINVDHKAQSISRNANLKAITEEMDVLMTHSLQNAFAKFLAKENIRTPLKKMGLGFDYDGHRAKYWKPIEEQNPAKTLWIGRSTGWKGPQLMIDFHEKELLGDGWVTVLEGLEASIGYKGIMYKDKEHTQRWNVVSYFRPEKEHDDPKWPKDGSQHGKEEPGMGAYLYPPYQNAEAMERMSLSAFGSDLYHLPAEMYGNNIENCHAEIIACGSIPIFHKHFCDNVVHKVQGKPITSCINTGTLALDESNYAEVSATMLKLRQDPGMRDEWREMAFEFWKQHSDGDAVVNEIIELAQSDEAQESEPEGLEEFFG